MLWRHRYNNDRGKFLPFIAARYHTLTSSTSYSQSLICFLLLSFAASAGCKNGWWHNQKGQEYFSMEGKANFIKCWKIHWHNRKSSDRTGNQAKKAKGEKGIALVDSQWQGDIFLWKCGRTSSQWCLLWVHRKRYTVFACFLLWFQIRVSQHRKKLIWKILRIADFVLSYRYNTWQCDCWGRNIHQRRKVYWETMDCRIQGWQAKVSWNERQRLGWEC